jgi:cell division protein DivIC
MTGNQNASEQEGRGMNKSARSNVLSLPKDQEQAPKMPPEVQTRRQKRRLNGRTLVLLGFTAWAAYVFFFVQSPDLKRIEEDHARLDAEIRQAIETNQDLQKKIDQLQDPDYIAELARTKYMMVKEGETLIVEPKQ